MGFHQSCFRKRQPTGNNHQLCAWTLVGSLGCFYCDMLWNICFISFSNHYNEPISVIVFSCLSLSLATCFVDRVDPLPCCLVIRVRLKNSSAAFVSSSSSFNLDGEWDKVNVSLHCVAWFRWDTFPCVLLTFRWKDRGSCVGIISSQQLCPHWLVLFSHHNRV